MDLQGNDRPSREREIFVAAIQKGTTEEQQQILADACGPDLDLRQRIEALLRTKDELGDFLERPCWVGIPCPAIQTIDCKGLIISVHSQETKQQIVKLL